MTDKEDDILFDDMLKYQPLSSREVVIIDKQQYERLKSENETLRNALKDIEHDARLSSDPGRAHSCQMSYDELLSGYRTLAAVARLALMKTRAI